MSATNVENPLQHANQKLNQRVTLLETISEEKEEIGAALRDSEKRYRRLFESAKDGILILDADTGKIVDVNPFLCQLLGYSYDKLFGQFIWDLGVFKDIAASKDAFKTLQDNEYIRYDNLPLETLDGHSIAVEFVSNVYLVDRSKVIQCNIRDITARRRAEMDLGESEAKRRNILENLRIGVALINPKMEVLELNRRMREWFPLVDLGRRSLCHHAFNEPPREAVCENCPTSKTLLDGQVHEETMCASRGGVMRNYRIVSSPLLNASGAVTAAIEMVEDVTERLSLESQLRHSQKMEAVGRLAGGVAHDFNNMLSVIIGNAEMALEKVDATQPLHADLLEILNAGMRSSAITRQLLAFARKQPIEPKVLDLNETVEGMLKMLRRLIGEDIDIIWLPETGLWQIKMDPTQVEQILTNLCVNARDAIAEVGKVTIETGNETLDDAYCADHAGALPGEYAILAISDNGCGMDKGDIDRIFEPFFTTKGLGHGTGLGLATVYGIVKQNNGFIYVYSELGKGTTFKIYLARHAGSAVDTQNESQGELLQGHGETVLVVEDEVSLLKLTGGILDMLNYIVLAAGTPGEALRLSDEYGGEIHLLITDVILPEMSGRDLAEQIQKIRPSMKCLFMSGYTPDVIVQRGMLDTDVRFIPKPFTKRALAAKVRTTLEKDRRTGSIDDRQRGSGETGIRPQ